MTACKNCQHAYWQRDKLGRRARLPGICEAKIDWPPIPKSIRIEAWKSHIFPGWNDGCPVFLEIKK